MPKLTLEHATLFNLWGVGPGHSEPRFIGVWESPAFIITTGLRLPHSAFGGVRNDFENYLGFIGQMAGFSFALLIRNLSYLMLTPFNLIYVKK